MNQSAPGQALFSGLVYDEDGHLVETTIVGAEPYYVIVDGDFRRHIEANVVDRQVIELIRDHALANKELVSEQIMSMLGQDDLFTKAMIDSSITRMDQAMQQGIPEDARMMLGMMGFKIVINVHGELVDLDMPGREIPGDEDW